MIEKVKKLYSRRVYPAYNVSFYDYDKVLDYIYIGKRLSDSLYIYYTFKANKLLSIRFTNERLGLNTFKSTVREEIKKLLLKKEIDKLINE